VGTVFAILFSAFVTGGLARLAVPGPDPMPVWLTLAIGLVGSTAGGGIAALVSHRNPYAISFGSLLAAVALVVAYRRFVQKRPISGPDALRFPDRGVGVAHYRDRLRRVGINPDHSPVPGAPAAPGEAAVPSAPEEHSTEGVEALQKLADLHDAGVLTDEEFDAKRRLVIERMRNPEGAGS
jgi:uncharacterized membrane protein YeaQ/YmgE (transglycosylase-associated protein family)